MDQKVRLLHLMAELGIVAADIGLPGAGPRVREQVVQLAKEIVSAKLNVAPNCAARTHLNDVRPIVEISQQVGIAIEAATFIGSSPIRQYTEETRRNHRNPRCEVSVVCVNVPHARSLDQEGIVHTHPGVQESAQAARRRLLSLP